MGMGMSEISMPGPNANPLIAPSYGRDRVCGFGARRSMSIRKYAADGFHLPIMVKLETGPRTTSDPDDARPKQIECEMPVEVVLENISGQVMLPKLRPQSSS
jgi:hypothetical protein